ncbi:MAG: class I SAM-dependent methyltransferase [Omnitrophica bacterium]|nr:class I SAM-dependent methyltransferase [Candidatus Omnitrophota bacterium]
MKQQSHQLLIGYVKKIIPQRILMLLRLLKAKDRHLYYYYRIYRKRILCSKPVVCDNASEFEVHIIISENDLLNALWCLKTFYHYSGLRPKLVFHEDGSLSADGIKTFLKHFINCRIIRWKDATKDLKHFLANYKYSKKNRLNEKFFCALKLFDPFYYTSTDKFLCLDSDVLFFKKPNELIGYIKNDKPFFSNDYRSSYSKPASQLNKIFGIDIFPAVNAGLMFMRKELYINNLDFIENYFEKMEDPQFHDINRHEQTLNALLLSKCRAIRLNDNYQISKQPITDKTISHHFVKDGSRNDFYKEGLKYLKLNKFLKEFNKVSHMRYDKIIKKYKPSKGELKSAKECNLYAGENHLGGYLRRNKKFPHGDPATWFPQLWRWVYDELGVRSVLDIGCGEGHSTRFFKDLGCEVLGVDGSIQAKKDSVIPEYHHIHDFNNGLFIPPKTYDLVWSCEFVEHVEEEYIDNFLKTFSYANKYIMMTHANPGQWGWHHVNCQPEEYWVKKLSQIGFKLDPQLTETSRKIAGGGHFARSGLVITKIKYDN